MMGLGDCRIGCKNANEMTAFLSPLRKAPKTKPRNIREIANVLDILLASLMLIQGIDVAECSIEQFTRRQI